jgi:hypothetical protein
MEADTGRNPVVVQNRLSLAFLQAQAEQSPPDFTRIDEKIRKNLEKAATKTQNKRKKGKIDVTWNVGMYALVRDKRRDAEFLFPFKGKIEEVNHNGRTVKLKWISNGPTEDDIPGSLSNSINTEDLKPYFHRNPPPEEPNLENNIMDISATLFEGKLIIEY